MDAPGTCGHAYKGAGKRRTPSGRYHSVSPLERVTKIRRFCGSRQPCLLYPTLLSPLCFSIYFLSFPFAHPQSLRLRTRVPFLYSTFSLPFYRAPFWMFIIPLSHPAYSSNPFNDCSLSPFPTFSIIPPTISSLLRLVSFPLIALLLFTLPLPCMDT